MMSDLCFCIPPSPTFLYLIFWDPPLFYWGALSGPSDTCTFRTGFLFVHFGEIVNMLPCAKFHVCRALLGLNINV